MKRIAFTLHCISLLTVSFTPNHFIVTTGPGLNLGKSKSNNRFLSTFLFRNLIVSY